MHFYTGIAFSEVTDHDVLVAATTWHKHAIPQFHTYNMSLRHMQKYLCAVIYTRNKDIVSAVNSACYRSVEHLWIKKYIEESSDPNITLLTEKSLMDYPFILPAEHKRNHWLINAAKCAIDAWYRGER